MCVQIDKCCFLQENKTYKKDIALAHASNTVRRQQQAGAADMPHETLFVWMFWPCEITRVSCQLCAQDLERHAESC